MASEQSDSDRDLFERNVAGASLRGDYGRAAMAQAVMALADAIREAEGRPLARLFREARRSDD